MTDFYRKFQLQNRQTPYPMKEIGGLGSSFVV